MSREDIARTKRNRAWNLKRRVESGNQYKKVCARYRKFRFLESEVAECALCEREFHKTELEVDHIVKRAFGGLNDFSNLQLLCHGCHLKKDQHIDNFPFREAFSKAGIA